MSETPPPRTRGQRVRRFIVRRLWFYPLIYLGVVLVFLSFEHSLVFNPSAPAKWWFEPIDPRTQDVWFEDANGTKLHGWWIPPDDPAAGAILVAHGKGGNVTHRGRLAADLRRLLGTGVLLYDYPGFGKSEGQPSESTCYDSGEAAYLWLKDEAHIAESNRASGRIARRRHRRRTRHAARTPGTRARLHVHDAARCREVPLPLASDQTADANALRQPLEARSLYAARVHLLRCRIACGSSCTSKLGRCTRPVFIAHGTADAIVPFHHGEQLFAAANEPKEFLRMEGMPHNMPLGDVFCTPLAAFLSKHAP